MCIVTQVTSTFRRDRFTWVAYVLLAYFAYLQAAPGLVLAYLRDELGLSYAVAGLHLSAFSACAIVAGLLSAWLEGVLGRVRLLWFAAALMGAGAVGLTAGSIAAVTIGSVGLMGLGGGLLLATVQAGLADHHGSLRAVALAEANVAASSAYLVLIAVLSVTAALSMGWRVGVLAAVAVPALMWWRNRGLTVEVTHARVARGRLPGVFWIAAAMLFCVVAAEWCITAWGASFVETAVDLPADLAIAVMAGYFGGVVVGRMAGSRLARRYDPTRLLAYALVVAAVGFVILWPSTGLVQALFGLVLVGIGIGNLFPMGMSLTVALVPEQAVLASGRAVSAGSFAVLLAPLTVGTLADATSLKAALGVMPAFLVLAGVGLVLVHRARIRTNA